jgi:peptidoglycan/xylan/chitin deacetylase (PgdA/CDA1 family)
VTDHLVRADANVGLSPSSGGKSQIAITFDLEMSRNFPNWEDTHWDYEKGNMNQAAKDYTERACQRVKDRGGVLHTFVVGQVFEQGSVDWLKQIAGGGHPIGNHTYDHIHLLAKKTENLQHRFRSAPWLLRGRRVKEVIRDNILLTNTALEKRVGVKANGFRTPGGFPDGLDGREDLQQLLQALGFDWISSRYPVHAGIRDLHGTEQAPSQEAYDNIVKAQRKAQPYVYPTGLIEVPMSPISDIGAFRNGRWQLAHFLRAIRLAMDWVIENGAVFDFLSHPSCLGVVDPNFQAIDLICDLVEQSQGKAELVSLDSIAQRTQ